MSLWDEGSLLLVVQHINTHSSLSPPKVSLQVLGHEDYDVDSAQQRKMAEDKPARYEGAYVPRISQDEIDAVYEQASMQPRFDHPAPGKAVPTVRDVTRDARKEAEDKVRPCAATQRLGPPACQIRLPGPPASCWLTPAGLHRRNPCTAASTWQRMLGLWCAPLVPCPHHLRAGPPQHATRSADARRPPAPPAPRPASYALLLARQDTRPIIDKKCHVNCKNMWDEYEKCEKRIEAKGTGDCSSWYMDYLRCIDGCGV